jgi:hypothetical protein
LASVPTPSTSTSTTSPAASVPTPSGVPGEDHVAGQQGHEGRDVFDQRRDAEHHLARLPRLADVAVHAGLDAHVVGVQVGLDPRPERARPVEPLRARPLIVGLLQVAERDVVPACVPEDVLERLLGTDVPRDPSDHDGQLPLVVDPAADRQQPDRVPGTDHGGRGLEEHQRLLGHLHPELGRVRCVVLPDADDLRRQDRRE